MSSGGWHAGFNFNLNAQQEPLWRREKGAVITIPQRILFKDRVMWHVPIIIIIIIIIIITFIIIIIAI